MSSSQPKSESFYPNEYPRDAIAVVGMACKFPGANSTEEYWELLDRGTSMATGPPPGRFPAYDHGRSTERSIFFGNFLADVDKFDHRFFNKSSREAASMDPSQRLLLEVAYQALESSGYFGQQHATLDVGCFIGVCVSDYCDNVASHPANAYSALGTLRAFLSGRISHFFGFTGPSITFDTACSSSAIAIDAACKAIRCGDCTTAIAGGSSVFTSPHLYQNLAAASFLSPTGATKPFGSNADGYCRGEGVGLVVLKTLSRAVEDGDHIIGVILSTCVQQNSNEVSITVPHVPSHISLYKRALNLAQVTPEDISYLEAHGTGTLIGDPKEFEGICKVFTRQARRFPLYFASVKGNIGHTEGASGVAALIKTLLMIQKRAIPRQASHSKPNPKVSLVPGQIQIPTMTLPWTAEPLIAFVSNHGAAGSIAAMIVREPYRQNHAPEKEQHMTKYPLLVTGNSYTSLRENCEIMRKHITSNLKSSAGILSSLMFRLSETQNRNLPYRLSAAISSMSDINLQLHSVASNEHSQFSYSSPKPKPIVLALGGQHGRFIGLSECIYKSCAILRSHLGECDSILKSFGHTGIFPYIFQTTPLDSIVLLQVMQFSLQYACAQSWIDCGLSIDCIVGHSLGELVGLSISGILSLYHGLKLVHDRASLMSTKWGNEHGRMIAIEADLQHVSNMIIPTRSSTSNSGLEIACYNGKRNFVLVGSELEVNMMIQSLDVSSGIRYKVLDVQRGFHSRFCEPMLADLEDLVGGLTYSTPKIQIERCSIEASPDAVTPAFIAQHTRKPVYFESAVKRVEQRLGACTWIEAGSGSSVTTMIRRALSPSQAHHHFFPVDFSHPSGLDKLAVTIATLGSNGYSVRFWPFHRLQRDWYSMLNLPPYQFEKTSHWLEFNLAEKQNQPGQTKPPIWPAPDVKPVLLKSCGSPNLSSLETSFIIDPRSEEYTTIVQGHSLLSNPVSPASLYIDIALQAARGLVKDLEIQPVPGARVKNLDIQSPLGTSQDRPIQLLLTRVSRDILEWDFLFFSRISNSDATSKITTYATGLVGLSELDSKIIPLDFSKFTALLQLGASASQDLQPDTNVVQGPLIYRLFSRVVDYHEFYRGVQKVTTSGNTIFSHVSLSDSQPAVVKDRLLRAVAVENFFQVPGFYFNCLHCTSDSAYICSKVDNIQFSPNFRSSGTSWDLISNVNSNNNRTFTADIFATDKSTGYIVVVAFGVHFKKVRLESLAATLASADVNSQNAPPSFFSGDDFVHSGPPVSAPSGRRAHSELLVPIEARISSSSSNSPAAGIMTPNAPLSDENDLDAKIRETLSHLTGVPAQEIVEYYPLGTLGIDSLMSMEIVSELASELNVSIPRDCIQDLKTFASLRDIVRAHMTPNFSAIQERANKTIISYPNNAPTSQPATERNARTISSESERDTSTTIDVSSWVISLLRSYLPCSDNEILNMTSLEAIGLDSLMCMELRSDVERTFGIMVDATPLMQASSLEELVDFIARAIAPGSSTQKSLSEMGPNVSKGCDFSMASENFKAVSSGFESLALEHGFTGFYDRVYDKNSQLVLAYTIEAFTKLGVSLQNLSAGDEIPLVTIDPRHQRLRGVLYEIIKSGGIANYDGEKYVRTSISIATRPSGILLEEIIAEFPQHANEHLLLNVCGSELSNLISGAKDPLVVLFGTAKNRAILEEVYSTSPMYLIMSQLLTRFLEVTLATSTPGSHNAFQIIEIGAGTGSTTKWVVDRLLHLGIPIEYTFTDISGALVSAGRRKFSQYRCMRYATIDIEKEPPTQYLNQFDIVLATNCIHATKNLRNSLGNIYKLLRPSGFVSLVEFTSRMFWFDLVFGLLEGWWRFDDGRSYVLASPEHWEQCMQDAGFSEIAWTGGSSRESEVVRVITGYKRSSAC